MTQQGDGADILVSMGSEGATYREVEVLRQTFD